MNLSYSHSTIICRSERANRILFCHPAIRDYCYYHFQEGLALSQPGFRHESSSCITVAFCAAFFAADRDLKS